MAPGTQVRLWPLEAFTAIIRESWLSRRVYWRTGINTVTKSFLKKEHLKKEKETRHLCTYALNVLTNHDLHLVTSVLHE